MKRAGFVGALSGIGVRWTQLARLCMGASIVFAGSAVGVATMFDALTR